MIPVATDVTNWSFHLPGRPGEGEMPCVRDLEKRTVTSFWKLEDSDDLNAVDAIFIQTYGFIPGVAYGLGDHAGSTTMRGVALVAYQGGGQVNMQLTDEVRKYLLDGNYFVLRVHQIPPPPVSVWLDKYGKGS